MNWWHDLEGGAVAEQRPPPPNADAPYPNLATVPPKPTPPDPALRAKIANALIADRANAQYAAAQNPIPDPSSRTASPGLFGGAVPPPPPADPDASNASLPAASTTAPARPAAMPFKPASSPAAAAPPSAAPRVGVSAASLAPPAEPTIAAAPPPPPNLPGVNIPVTAPTLPPVAPPAPPAGPRVATAADQVPVAFAPGSAVLPPGSDGPLKHLVSIMKGSKGIAVTGFGEADSSSPDVQTAGVKLGMLRAQAIASVLASIGLPPSLMRIDAQAAGTGGEARIWN